jgi:glycosyltransferase involved in cell wall biosynthesis
MAPVLWTEQGRFPDRRGTGPLRAAYARAARDVGAIVCVSDAVRDDVAKICGPRGPRLEVIPNPVDTERFRPPSADERSAARAELGVPATVGPVFVTSGRLHPAKQIDLAIQAAAGVDGAHLVVAGDGPDRERLQGLANGHVTFTGRVDRPELVYAAGDAFVLPSSASAREGLSLAMLEAAASGLPVVTVEGSGMEEHASAGGGLVADPEPGSLAEALELAAALPGDRPREWVAAFDLRSCARRHADLMRELIAEGAR